MTLQLEKARLIFCKDQILLAAGNYDNELHKRLGFKTSKLCASKNAFELALHVYITQYNKVQETINQSVSE